jgi:hypothetical protein
MLAKRAILVPIVVALFGVTSCRDDSVQPAAVVEGQWGAAHVSLLADAEGGTLEYDCAIGTIDAALVLDADGSFDVPGTHTRGTGGPAHLDQRPDTHPARYEGRLSKDTLTLTVTLTDTGDVIGPFNLVRGERGVIYKCL